MPARSGELDFGTREPSREKLTEGAYLLRDFATAQAGDLLRGVEVVSGVSPFRHMTVRGGRRMSVAMTNCGTLGWVSDQHGYRYDRTDPATGRAWPEMPKVFRELAERAAAEGGFLAFHPDACLVNRYEPGAQMGLHQDRDELDFGAPIVSVSLGLPATFLFGGEQRKERPRRMVVESGDVVVWGGPARLFYHGVAKLAEGIHPLTGRSRINLTFRKAGA
jgi:alkylated DNA repair protein (DNA oxidative demethylase)